MIVSLLPPQVRKATEFIAWLSAHGVELSTRKTPMMVQCRWAAWLVFRHWGLSLSEIARLTKCGHGAVSRGITQASRRADVAALADEWIVRFDENA